MIKRTLLAAAIFSTLPAYAGLTSITAGYDFTDYSGDHGNRNLAYAELVAKVENATLLFNLSQGRRDYETEHFNATRGQGAVWYKWNNWLTTRTGIAFADNTRSLPARIFVRILTWHCCQKRFSRPVIATRNITMMSKSMPGKAAYHSILAR